LGAVDDATGHYRQKGHRVTAFCILIMLALLPVGANAAVGSRREMRASYLAEQIVSDLRNSSFTNASVLYPNAGALSVLTSFGLQTNGTYAVTCDAGENVLAATTAVNYTNGVNAGGANYLVQIAVLTNAIPNLSSVSVEVSAPAQSKLTSRTRYGFQTMIGNRQ
jgi:hypothetical protein